MIHQLLNLTRPLIVFDTETTGVDRKNDRIVEIGFQIWSPDYKCWKCCGGQLPPEEKDTPADSSRCPICSGTGRLSGLQKEFRTLVNPMMPIPAEVTEIHHIADADFLNCRTCNEPLVDHPNMTCAQERRWPTFKELAPSLLIGFKDCDYAGKNVRFDLQILAAEMVRNGFQWSYAGARVIDIDRLEAWLNKRSLSHLYRKYVRILCASCHGEGKIVQEAIPPHLIFKTCTVCHGTGLIGKKLEGAHGALTDVQGSTVVLEAQFNEHVQNEDEPSMLPRDLDALHALQWPGWIDSEGLFVFTKGVPCFGRWGKYAGKPMTAADNGYWDYILREGFSQEVKAIAGQAKMKVYPKEKA